MNPFKSKYLNMIFKKFRSSKDSNCAYTIYDLPCEMLINIFSFFDLIDLIELRLVCKTWSTIIKNECKFTELNIINSPNEIYGNGNYFILNKPYNYQYTLIHFLSPSIKLKLNLFKLLFTELKYLNLNFEIYDDFNFEFFKLFEHLIHLEIRCLSLKEAKILYSKSLKRLAIYDLNINNNDLLIIDAMQLKFLKCSGKINNIKFNHPNSIEYLNFYSQYKSLERYDFLKKFNSLSILNCVFNNQIKLSELPIKLKQLNFFNHSFKFFGTLRSKLNNLLVEKTELKRSDLLISFQGIILNEHNIDQINSKDSLIIRLNSDISIKGKSVNICALDENNIDNLITKLSNNVPINNQFESKFINIQTMRISNLDTKEQNNLLNLLAKLKRLRHLNLTNVSLNQNFYDELSIICSQLNKLTIVQHSNSFDINLEHLISKLNYLFILDINLKLDFKFVFNCLEVSKYLWYIRTANLIIVKIRYNKFSLILNKIHYHSLSFEQLKKKLFCKKFN